MKSDGGTEPCSVITSSGSPTNHTKQALVALIRRHYGEIGIDSLADFDVTTGISSFQELLQNADGHAHLRPGGNGIRVIREWTSVITRRYYELVHRALREADPTALIFGDRLPSYYDPDAVRAMAPFVDAIATNYNVDSPDGWIAHYYFDGLRQLTGNKPVLISEWYFAAQENRTGNLNNGYLMTVRTQAERARGAASAARHFALEPGDRRTSLVSILRRAQGRSRVETTRITTLACVDIDGRPYEELVAALTAANRSLAELHQSAAPRTPGEGDRHDSDPRGRTSTLPLDLASAMAEGRGPGEGPLRAFAGSRFRRPVPGVEPAGTAPGHYQHGPLRSASACV